MTMPMCRAREIIKKTLDALDIEGLLALGAPDDEYEQETYMYANYIVDNDNITFDEVRKLWAGQFMGSDDESIEKYYTNPKFMRSIDELTDVLTRLAEELKDD
jgi:hypothetical protein